MQVVSIAVWVADQPQVELALPLSAVGVHLWCSLTARSSCVSGSSVHIHAGTHAWPPFYPRRACLLSTHSHLLTLHCPFFHTYSLLFPCGSLRLQSSITHSWKRCTPRWVTLFLFRKLLDFESQRVAFIQTVPHRITVEVIQSPMNARA